MRVFPFLALGLLGLGTPAYADRTDSIEYVRKAEASLAKGRPRDARIELLNAIAEEPTYGAAHLLQAQVYLKLGNGVAAEAELGRARESGIPLPRMRHLMADALLLQNAPERALAEADPKSVPHTFTAYVVPLRLTRDTRMRCCSGVNWRGSNMGRRPPCHGSSVRSRSIRTMLPYCWPAHRCWARWAACGRCWP